MNDKFLHDIRRLFLFSAVGVCSGVLAGPWNGSPVGRCYASLDQYAREIFGPDYKMDENIQFISLPEVGSKISNSHFYWVTDLTPSQNQSQILFKTDVSGKSCVVLLVVASTSVSLRQIVDGKLPEKVVAEDSVPSGWATQIVYRLDRGTQTYHAARCYKVMPGKPRRSIFCGNAF